MKHLREGAAHARERGHDHGHDPAERDRSCGYRIEEIEDPIMRQVRYMDKLVDELAKGRAMEKILRK